MVFNRWGYNNMDKIQRYLKETWKLFELEDSDPSYIFLERYRGSGYYVRFIEEGSDKLIKMSSGHGDPSGTYAFPIEYVLSKWSKGNIFFKLRHIQVIKDMSKSSLVLNSVRSFSRAEMILDKMGIKLDVFRLNRVVNDIGSSLEGELYNIEKDTIHPALFFNLVQLNAGSDRQRLLWLKAGYDCLKDTGNPPVIHPDEPEQVLFLTLDSYKVVDSYEQSGSGVERVLRKFISRLYEVVGERITKYTHKGEIFYKFNQELIKTLGRGHSITLLYRKYLSGEYMVRISIFGPRIEVDFDKEAFVLDRTTIGFDELLKKVVEYYGLDKEPSSDKKYYSKQKEL